jgi:hypothetical protein
LIIRELGLKPQEVDALGDEEFIRCAATASLLVEIEREQFNSAVQKSVGSSLL